MAVDNLYQVRQNLLRNIKTFCQQIAQECGAYDGLIALMGSYNPSIVGASFVDDEPNATPPIIGDFVGTAGIGGLLAPYTQADVVSALADLETARVAVTPAMLQRFSKWGST